MTANNKITFPRQILSRISWKSTKSTTESTDQSSCGSQIQETVKHVQFAPSTSDDSLSVRAQYIEPSYELTDEICEDVWWSAEERLENDLERRQLTRAFRKGKETGFLDTRFESLYECCTTLNATQVLRNKENKQVLVDVIANNEGLRGLESKLSAATSRRRKNHILAMLSICSFDTDCGESFTENLKQSSRASGILARAMAIVDAKEASV